MKQNELMIGDHVFSLIDRCGVIEKKAVRVTGIRTDCDYPYIQTGESDVWYSVETYEPIPLTPEILEKNGFIRDGESWWYKDFRIVLFTSNGVSLVCGRQMRFKYVHELQQALRLCQIDKEIIL